MTYRELEAVRRRLHLTQRELAEDVLGVALSTYTTWAPNRAGGGQVPLCHAYSIEAHLALAEERLWDMLENRRRTADG